MHYERAPRFRRSKPDEAPPPLRCAVQELRSATATRELELEDRPFQTKEVAEWLRNPEGISLTLYWSRTRPRR